MCSIALPPVPPVQESTTTSDTTIVDNRFDVPCGCTVVVSGEDIPFPGADYGDESYGWGVCEEGPTPEIMAPSFSGSFEWTVTVEEGKARCHVFDNCQVYVGLVVQPETTQSQHAAFARQRAEAYAVYANGDPYVPSKGGWFMSREWIWAARQGNDPISPYGPAEGREHYPHRIIKVEDNVEESDVFVLRITIPVQKEKGKEEDKDKEEERCARISIHHRASRLEGEEREIHAFDGVPLEVVPRLRAMVAKRGSPPMKVCFACAYNE
mgnify:CR=1 FL=1